MANFNLAINKLLKNEGLYVNDPDDAGGETFAGISRKNNKLWPGWKIIDKTKTDLGIMLPQGKSRLNTALSNNKELMNLVNKLYKEKYWDIFNLDLVPSFNIAFLIFDTCVNMGPKAAVKFAEHSVGLNETGKFTDELFNKIVKYK